MNNANEERYTQKIEDDRLVDYLVGNNIIYKKIRIWLTFINYNGAIYKVLKKMVLKI